MLLVENLLKNIKHALYESYVEDLDWYDIADLIYKSAKKIRPMAYQAEFFNGLKQILNDFCFDIHSFKKIPEPVNELIENMEELVDMEESFQCLCCLN